MKFVPQLHPKKEYSAPVGAIIRFQAWDNTHMAVNSDGSGGVPSDGGTVGFLKDITGNGNNLTNGTVATQPIWRAGNGLNFPVQPGASNCTLSSTSLATTFPNATSSGGIATWVQQNGSQVQPYFWSWSDSGNTQQMVFDTNGALSWVDIGAFHSTGLFPTARRCIVTWRSLASDLIFRVNGQQFNFGSAAQSWTAAKMFLNAAPAAGGQQVRLFEAILYNTDIGATSIAQLERYLRFRLGSAGNPTRTVELYGDSLTSGVGSATNKPWWDYVTNRSGSLWYNFSCSGQFGPFDNQVPTSTLISLKGSNEGVVVIWIGTNDIFQGFRTGAQFYSDLTSYCNTLTAAGLKVIGTTLLSTTATNGAEVVNFNTAIRANHSFLTAFVDLQGISQLSDDTNTTYFQSDKVHLTDAGYAIVGSAFQTAMASI